MPDECQKMVSDLERKLFIVEILNNTQMMNIRKPFEKRIHPNEQRENFCRGLRRYSINYRKRRFSEIKEDFGQVLILPEGVCTDLINVLEGRGNYVYD